MSYKTSSIAVYSSVMVAVATAIALISCSKVKDDDPARIVPKSEIAGWNGSDFYQEISFDSLPKLHAVYREALSDLGLPKARWDEKLDCNQLADAYIAVNQVKFLVDNWHRETKAQGLALGVVWFKRRDGQYHAVVEARMDGKTVYIDPAIGPGLIELLPSEIASIYFRKY